MVSKKILGGIVVLVLITGFLLISGGDGAPEEEMPDEIPVNVYTASEDTSVHHLDMDSNQTWTYDEHGDAVTSVTVASDGSILTSALDGSHRIATDGTQQQTIREGSWLNDVAIDDEDMIYLADDSGIVYKHDADGNELWTYEEHFDSVQGLAVGDGNIYTAGRDGEAHKVSSEGDQLWTYTEHQTVFDVAADSDGDIYTAGDGVHKVSSEGDQLWTYDGHGGANVGGITVHDGQVYTVGDSGELHVLDAESGDHLWTYGQDVWINDVAVDDAGYVYTAANNGQVHKIDPRGDQVWSYTQHRGHVRGIAVVSR